MLKANEARKLAGVGDEERAKELVESALVLVKRSASNGSRSVNIHGDPWVYGAYRGDPDVKLAYKMLEDLGYQVRYHYEELQFVNAYTVVGW